MVPHAGSGFSRKRTARGRDRRARWQTALMSTPIEDYALLSDARTAALVSRAGGIDWLCAPRLDAASLFGALLGGKEQGHWDLRPADPSATLTRRYDGDTFTLVSRWQTADGTADVREWMPIGADGADAASAGENRTDVIRRIIGIEGTVAFVQELRLRFDYARAVPWVRQTGTAEEPALTATAGPDAVVIRGAALHPDGRSHAGTVTVSAGERVDLTLTWHPSYRPEPARLDVDAAERETRDWWQRWSARIRDRGPDADAVRRSRLILRALTNRDTGGIAAAATTSLPEDFGGERNWDYRYVWLRDAALALEALIDHGLVDEAVAWRDWLLRAVAGDPADLQIMYGMAGERDLREREMPSLPGYAGSAPVRVGNGAEGQYQADVVGEVMVTLAAARRAGLAESTRSWSVQRVLLRHAESQLDRPDNGMWEIRGDPRFFTHSRVMLWAAFDRGITGVERDGRPGPAKQWRTVRDGLRAEIDARGVRDGGFVQHDDTDEVDAALLLIPRTGFCAPDDERMLVTVERIEQTLMRDGLVLRYRTSSGVDGLSGAEHPFLACSFWLVEQYAATGRTDDARRLMTRLCAYRNDVGLLSEEYDPVGRRQVGNTPQAFSHLALIRAADALAAARHRMR
ncbi:glycoside hydrolase family 15 protein [Microbacterium capsulatum]|uniref:Glycoside hydrolase family 15 protein n=1 Tax=Microbacterium capsulatum TaxID=3041921 RepID=A0ABU0XET8_9MICO|nr:glycoside hydrolase family 15 protein [Microbacterium sp. ASV81]MDQ4213442.1 glycoside hydrolase family 15 protein [Microbacterium sp. ASV81]